MPVWQGLVLRKPLPAVAGWGGDGSLTADGLVRDGPEGGACVTAVRRPRAEGWINPDDEGVIFNTGAGTKDVEVLPSL